MRTLLRGCAVTAVAIVVVAYSTIAVSWLGIWWPRMAIGNLLSSATCHEERATHVPAPDGRYVADVTVENCTVLATVVTVRRSTDPFRWGEEQPVFAARKAEPIQVAWQDNTTLVVTYSGDPTYIYARHDTVWGGIHVLFW